MKLEGISDLMKDSGTDKHVLFVGLKNQPIIIPSKGMFG